MRNNIKNKKSIMEDILAWLAENNHTLVGTIIGSSLLWISPVVPLLTTVAIFVFIDTVYAIHRVLKLKKETLQSHKFFNVFIKLGVYMFVILLGYSVGVVFYGGIIFGVNYPITKILCLWAILTELKSIDETRMLLGKESLFVILRNFAKEVSGIKKDLKAISSDIEVSSEREENDDTPAINQNKTINK